MGRREEERGGEGRGGDEDVRREPQGADAQPQSHVATFMHLRVSRATCGP